MDCLDPICKWPLKQEDYDSKIPDHDSIKALVNKLKQGKLVEQNYLYFVEWLTGSDEQTKVIRSKDQNENENENENEDVNIDAAGNDKDPQYRMFLENLTEHGKSYKLKISQNDEEPRYLYYEEPDNSDWCDELQTCIDNSGEDAFEDLQINQKAAIKRVNEKNIRVISTTKAVYKRKKFKNDHNSITTPLHQEMLVDSTKKEVSRRKKINDHEPIIQTHRGVIVDPSDQMFQNSIPSEHGAAVKTEGNLMEYKKNITPSDSDSDSDSDIIHLDNAQNCIEVNDKQLVLVEKESSLREKLMHVLEQPYSEKEYEELSEFIEQKKPICRLLDLRGRAISSALTGVAKSVLDDGPRDFRRMLKAAHNDRPKALNLLRMFGFWLEHIPNKDVFAPWEDKHILKVRPSE